MDKISVRFPKFSDEFKALIAKAEIKKVSCFIDYQPDSLDVRIVANKRNVGRFHFNIEEDKAVLDSKLIIEQEYYPFEVCLNSLVQTLKRRKVKYILI